MKRFNCQRTASSRVLGRPSCKTTVSRLKSVSGSQVVFIYFSWLCLIQLQTRMFGIWRGMRPSHSPLFTLFQPGTPVPPIRCFPLSLCQSVFRNVPTRQPSNSLSLSHSLPSWRFPTETSWPEDERYEMGPSTWLEVGVGLAQALRRGLRANRVWVSGWHG